MFAGASIWPPFLLSLPHLPLQPRPVAAIRLLRVPTAFVSACSGAWAACARHCSGLHRTFIRDELVDGKAQQWGASVQFWETLGRLPSGCELYGRH